MRFVLLVLVALQAAAVRAPHATIADAALAQVGVTTIYDPAYVRLHYPGGDVPRERGGGRRPAVGGAGGQGRAFSRLSEDVGGARRGREHRPPPCPEPDDVLRPP